jgi:hypothetical protein
MKKLLFFLFIVVIITIFAGITPVYAMTQDDDHLGADYSEVIIEDENELLSEPEVEMFTVRFHLDGGLLDGQDTVSEQIIPHGGLVLKPNKPIKVHSGTFWNPATMQYDTYNHEEEFTKGYEFKGWRVAGQYSLGFWDFDVDIVEEDILLWAEWGEYSTNYELHNSYYHIKGKYWENWDFFNRQKFVSVEHLVHGRPVEMGGSTSQPYTRMSTIGEELHQAKLASGIVSTYGGCGPLALIGMFDFLATYRGYSNLLPNPEDFNDRVQLATNVFMLSHTIEVGFEDKSTYMSEDWFIEGAENVLDNAGYSGSYNFITTNNHNSIKQSIDKGIPVSIWTALLGGEGYLDLHWFTIYGYEEWKISDTQGYSEYTTMYLIRSNLGKGQDSWEYMDADLIPSYLPFLWGAVIFEEVFIETTILQADYGFESQYFFYEKLKEITLSNGYRLFTNRLRTGYVFSYDSLGSVNGRFLVMSANRQNAGTAFLEYTFDHGVRGIMFDISLWSGSEGLAYHSSSVRLEIMINDNWVIRKNFDILQISKDRNHRDEYLLYFDHPVSEIRFIVETTYPSGTRNKGRVVLGDVTILY